MKEGPVEWLPKDAFVMPTLPPELQIDPMLAALLHLAAFLELSGDDAVDPDWAVETLEHMTHYLESLLDSEAERIQNQLDRIAEYGEQQQWPSDATDFVREFLRTAGLGDELE